MRSTNNIHQARCASVSKKHYAMMFSVYTALALLGLVGSQPARAQALVFNWYKAAGSSVVQRDKPAVTPDICPDVLPDPIDLLPDPFDEPCPDDANQMAPPPDPFDEPFPDPPDPFDLPPLDDPKENLFPPPPLPPATNKTLRRSATRAIAAASTTLTPALNSSTPYVPFLGNQLVVVGYVPNAPLFVNTTAAYSVTLRRQSDCSLVEDFVQPAATTPNAGIIASLSAAQDYFHQLSGLTTTPDVFAQGCKYPILGQPSSSTVLLLGTTADGGVIGAEVSSGLYVFVADPVANTFTQTQVIGTNAINGNLSAADLNGDGFVDIVATFVTDPTTQLQSTAVLLGNGDGTFKPPVYYDVPGDITIDDVNGDGKPDIVVCGPISAPGITTLIGKGDGTFTPGSVSATSVGACGLAAAEVLTGDFNGDGKKDLLVHGLVLLGNGDGTFTVGTPVTSDTTFNFTSSIAVVAVGDVNKDGKLDVVVSQPGFVALFYGNGDGTFTAGPRYAALPDYMQVSITDVDGDGNPDIILGTSTGGIYTDGGYDIQPPLFQILMGRGDGTFVDSAAYNQGEYGNGFATVAGPQIASADFNGDGKPDVLVFNPNNDELLPSSLAMLPGDGTGKLGTAVNSTLTLHPTMLVAADMNKDGKPDAVLAGTRVAGPVLSVLINQGNGTFTGEQDYALPNPAVSLAVGDFNGDGLMDVAVGVAAGLGGSGPSGVYVMLGQANGTLAAPVQIDTSLNPTGLAAGDINGDGRTDLIVADQGFFSYVGAPQQVNGTLHVYLGNANGTFTAAATPSTSAINYSVAALGDLNGDGKLDLIVAGNVTGTSIGAGAPNLYTLLGNGDGTFQTAKRGQLSGTDGIGATSIALADLNKDGKLDVVVGNANDFTEVLLGLGDGTLVHTLLALGQRPLALAAADLNGDGFPELLVGTAGITGGENLSVFLNANAWAAASGLPATTTTLMSSATPITTGQSITLTATVAAASGTTVPTGSVTFLDGSTTLGTGTLGASGTATYTTTALTAGSQVLTASYGGSATFAGSTSSAITVTVTAGAPDFAAALSPTSGTIAPGQSAMTTLTLTPSNGFSQTVALSCSGLPTGAACSFSSASVAVNGSAATSTLTITTAGATAMNSTSTPFNPQVPGGILFATIGVPIVLRRRRTAARLLRSALIALLFVGAGTLLQSCGGSGGSGGSGSGSSSGTPAGTYTVTVTATAGSTTHSGAYTLTVN
jgi:hypothetical protein